MARKRAKVQTDTPQPQKAARATTARHRVTREHAHPRPARCTHQGLQPVFKPNTNIVIRHTNVSAVTLWLDDPRFRICQLCGQRWRFDASRSDWVAIDTLGRRKRPRAGEDLPPGLKHGLYSQLALAM